MLRSDEVRKELAGLDPLEHAPAAYGAGLYAPSITDATYETLLSRARQLLAWGESVIVDASFAAASWRDEAARLATDTDAEHTALHCLLPPSVAAARLARRAAEGRDASDATAVDRRRDGPRVRAVAQCDRRGHPPTRRGRGCPLSSTGWTPGASPHGPSRRLT